LLHEHSVVSILSLGNSNAVRSLVSSCKKKWMEHTTTTLHPQIGSDVEYMECTIGKPHLASGTKPSSFSCTTLAAASICWCACPSHNHGTGSFGERTHRQSSSGRRGNTNPVKAQPCNVGDPEVFTQPALYLHARCVESIQQLPAILDSGLV
jgi:hypothetical protein